MLACLIWFKVRCRELNSSSIRNEGHTQIEWHFIEWFQIRDLIRDFIHSWSRNSMCLLMQDTYIKFSKLTARCGSPEIKMEPGFPVRISTPHSNFYNGCRAIILRGSTNVQKPAKHGSVYKLRIIIINITLILSTKNINNYCNMTCSLHLQCDSFAARKLGTALYWWPFSGEVVLINLLTSKTYRSYSMALKSTHSTKGTSER